MMILYIYKVKQGGLRRVLIFKCLRFDGGGYVTDGRKYHSYQHLFCPPPKPILPFKDITVVDRGNVFTLHPANIVL